MWRGIPTVGSLSAELLLLRRRAANWILLAIAVLLTLFFAYVLPYYAYVSDSGAPGFRTELSALLPEGFVATLASGFPFYIGILGLILGVLVFGSEYGWATLKTTLMQRPGRIRWLLAKLGALAIALVVATVAVYAAGALFSVGVTLWEGAAISWPSAGEILRGMGAGWLILSLWTLLGVLLAVLSRGTALALGLGIMYGLVVEGLVSGFGNSIALLHDLSLAFLRTNAYSLVAPLTGQSSDAGGPGAFSGPFVDPWQALVVIAGYIVLFGGISALLLYRRDVT